MFHLPVASNQLLQLLITLLTHAHVAALGVMVQVVRVDIEGHQADGGEGRRVYDGHVVGGVDADSRHVGAGARAHIGDAILRRREDRKEEGGQETVEDTGGRTGGV